MSDCPETRYRSLFVHLQRYRREGDLDSAKEDRLLDDMDKAWEMIPDEHRRFVEAWVLSFQHSQKSS